MTVGDIMSGDVEFIAADATAQQAAELMGEIDVGALPVGTAEAVTGIITDRDILYRVVARGLDPTVTRVRDVASRPVLCCKTQDGVRVAMDLMAANHVRRLPVQDESSRVVGWITMADLSRRLLVDHTGVQDALRELTEG